MGEIIPMDRLGQAVDEMLQGPNHAEEAQYWRSKYWDMSEKYHEVIGQIEELLLKEKI